MPFIAINDTGEFVNVLDADKGTYSCIDCGRELSLVSEHERQQNGITTTVVRHFRHPSNSCTGGSGGGGESQFHRRRKHEILVAAVNQFECALYGTEDSPEVDTTIGGYQADAIVVFEEPKPPYGRGLALEFQHKNESKDIDAVTESYLSNKFTAVWVWDEQVDDTGGIPEVDLFGGRFETPWPGQLPDHIHDTVQSQYYSARESWQRAYSLGLVEAGIPARLPPDWVDEISKEIWRSQSWISLFHPEPLDELSGSSLYLADQYIEEIKVTGETSVRATLPADCIIELSKRYFRNTDWAELFGRKDSPVFYNPTTQYIEDACRSAVNQDSWEMKTRIPFLRWVSDEDSPTRTKYGKKLRKAVRKGRERDSRTTPGIRVRNRVISVVDKNTGGKQPEAMRITSIKQKLMRRNYGTDSGFRPENVERAISALVQKGRLAVTEGGGRVQLSE